MVTRGNSGNFSAGRSDNFDFSVSFDLFELDVNGNEIFPTINTSQLFLNSNDFPLNEVTSYTFTNVIENFSGFLGSEDPTEIFSAVEFNSLVFNAPRLNLTARYLPAGSILTRADGTPLLNLVNSDEEEFFSQIGGEALLSANNDNKGLVLTEDRIEYIFTGDGLPEGISEIVFFISDTDNPVLSRIGSESLSMNPVLQIEGQQALLEGSSLQIDVDGDGDLEFIFLEQEFLRINGIDYPIFDSFDVNSIFDDFDVENEGEFIIFPDTSGEDTIFSVTGEFGNESIQREGFGSLIDTQGRFVQDSNGQLFQVEGNFLEIGGELFGGELDGEIIEVQGNLGEEFIEFRGEIIGLDRLTSRFSRSPFFSFNPVSQIEVGGEVIDTEGEQLAATNDLEFIIEVLSSTDYFRIVGDSEEDPNTIIAVEEFLGLGSNSIIQAEDLTLDTYLPEQLSSGGEVISLLNASDLTGTASLIAEDFSIEPGSYDLSLSVFDENDGEAQLQVFVNGEPVLDFNEDPQIIVLDEETSSGLPIEDVRREFFVSGIEITDPSDVISIVGTADDDPAGGEWARVDFLSFIEV